MQMLVSQTLRVSGGNITKHKVPAVFPVAQTIIIRSTTPNKDRKALEIRRDLKSGPSVGLCLWVNPAAGSVWVSFFLVNCLQTRQISTLSTGLDDTGMGRWAKLERALFYAAMNPPRRPRDTPPPLREHDHIRKSVTERSSREWNCGEGVKRSCSPVGVWRSRLFARLRNHWPEGEYMWRSAAFASRRRITTTQLLRGVAAFPGLDAQIFSCGCWRQLPTAVNPTSTTHGLRE